MRGKLEVYRCYGTSDEELLIEGQNTVVDGAGEVLVDIMTAHSSLSGIPDLSSILDTSNYTIQAISFGKDSKGYQRHAHELTARKGYGAFNSVPNNDPLVRVVVIQSGDPEVSSYVPTDAGNLLPSFVTPRQTQLELNALVSGEVTDQNGDPFDPPSSISGLCSGISDIGHNLNTLAYASDLSSTSAILVPGMSQLLGCYPAGSGTGGTPFWAVSSDAGVQIGAAGFSDVIYASSYNSLFNQVSSMDTSGFVNFVGSSTTDTALAAGWSGLTVSANTAINHALHASTTGEIAYKVIIGSGDVGACNLYGGIYNIGLWAMDLCKAQKYNNPPFTFDPITNEKRYKLFSKKSLLDNISRTVDYGDPKDPGCNRYEDLTLIWRLYFV
tara:strand:- start:7098 stop:8249 length:1152 start_codon:yes stop_codon:yes gene_type:complete